MLLAPVNDVFFKLIVHDELHFLHCILAVHDVLQHLFDEARRFVDVRFELVVLNDVVYVYSLKSFNH